MTSEHDRSFPPALAAALAVPFDFREGDGVDFEPFPEFLPAGQATEWFRAWTGNEALSGDDFLVFGQDGTGGYAAFWLVRVGVPVAEQPLVFLGSEGEVAVLARDLGEFLWLLAAGYGPQEAAAYGPDHAAVPDRALTEVAERFAPGARRPAAEVLARAAAEFPDFEEALMEFCQ
ncbi:SMI1/KNR4 family protein [Kitasatospora sp. NPDC048365]|uniref:SMI1/KNR4 family protein n=1 Tax=Kitasatospora sp. NPDC048365 TaxID=3364050 RepID=UPI003713C39B